MLTIEQILENKIYPPKKEKQRGVYFLIKNDNIIYVGSTGDFEYRLRIHKANTRIRFDSYFFIPEYNDKEMQRMECNYIKELRPKYNFTGNPDYYNGDKEVLRTVLNEWDSNREISELVSCSSSMVAQVIANRNPNIKNEVRIEVIKTIMKRYVPTSGIPNFLDNNPEYKETQE